MNTSYSTKYFLLFISSFIFFVADAQWSNDPWVNNAICTDIDAQMYPSIVTDENGGAIIAWMDQRNEGIDNVWDIYVQCISKNGILKWTTAGQPICTATNDQTGVNLISDGNGGAIITWNDNRVGNKWNIYAQRIDSNGVIQWANDGIIICTDTNTKQNPQIISDGNGGAIIAWLDYRNNGNESDIYAQKISSAGTLQWANDGVAICTAPEDQGTSTTIISDGMGGAIITWDDNRTGVFYRDIYSQRINHAGMVQWTNNGVGICVDTSSQNAPTTVLDGSGGCIITWMDMRNSTGGAIFDIYAQRINANGLAQWINNGIPVCSAAGSQTYPVITHDGNGGAIIAWTDARNGPSTFCIYSQHVSSTGILLWSTDGISITPPGIGGSPKIISHENGGAILGYPVLGSAVYAQWIDVNGILKWGNSYGLVVSTNFTSVNKSVPVIVNDGNGGAIFAWTDDRASNYDIYAQRIDNNGILPVQELFFSESVNILPTLSTGIFNINSSEKIQFSVYDIYGRQVFQSKSLNRSSTLDLSSYPKGIYFVRGKSNDKIFSRKIVLQ